MDGDPHVNGPAATVRRPAAPGGTRLFLTLSEQVRASGLLRRRRGYYWRRLAAVAAALLALVLVSRRLDESWWQLALAPLLALVLTQVAFLGHDAAHRQVFESARWNEGAARVLASLCAGLSYGWWLGKHEAHHVAPNQRGRDSDIESKALAFYPEALARMGGVHVWLLRHQGLWFFPLLLLEGANLHVDSVRAVLRRGRRARRWLDVVLVLGHWAVYLGVLTTTMTAGQAVAFLALDLACFGVLLGGAFAPNHTGMPILEHGVRLDFLRRQVSASRNVRGGWPVDFLMGGLNHQVEHHLFPNMPRPNLRRVQPIVREFCATHDIAYTETSFGGAYRAVVHHLNAVGLRGRRRNSCPLAAQLRS